VNREEGCKGRLARVSSSQSNASSGFSEERAEISEEDSGEVTSHTCMMSFKVSIAALH